jgi:hypothetical protein
MRKRHHLCIVHTVVEKAEEKTWIRRRKTGTWPCKQDKTFLSWFVIKISKCNCVYWSKNSRPIINYIKEIGPPPPCSLHKDTIGRNILPYLEILLSSDSSKSLLTSNLNNFFIISNSGKLFGGLLGSKISWHGKISLVLDFPLFNSVSMTNFRSLQLKKF